MKLIIITAILFQLITGLFIIFSPNPINVARLGIFYQIFPYFQLGGMLMLFSSLMGLFALRSEKEWAFWLYLPQFFFLLLSAGSISAYIVQQHYADGTMRPWFFIFIDQLLSLIVTAVYSYSIIKIIKRETT